MIWRRSENTMNGRRITNRKIIVAVIIAVVLAILLIPCRLQYKDGGSIEYKAVTYSITKYHRLSPLGSEADLAGIQFLEGWKIELFGITLRDDLADLKY